MAEQQEPEVHPGSVIITPSQIYEQMQGIRDEVKHLASVVDPALTEVRTGIATNAARIELIVAERKSEDEKLAERIHNLETAGFVTSTRMWTVVAVLATVIVSAITAITYLQQT